ncbi:hypothetical protein CPLU01_15148 [Colletotrichum plurivorum]|uniref:Uncharacterized protein n=1 Tax=Colletotrichum plurivorum TaxID=2175906 RepID=A0A8H6JDQ6_9PEZI|nr:hypothetical protein CPLU01_15148 [Colletotrichum plurivorum]
MNGLLKITSERLLLDFVGTARVVDRVGVVRGTTTGSVVEASIVAALISVDIGLDDAPVLSAVSSQDDLTAFTRSDPSVVQPLLFREGMDVL